MIDTLNGSMKKEYYSKNKQEIALSNFEMLKLISLISGFGLLGFLVLRLIFKPFELPIMMMFMGFLVVFVLGLLIPLLFIKYNKVTYVRAKIVLYAFIIAFLSLVIVCETVLSKQEVGMFFPIFLITAPILFLIPMVDLVVGSFLFTVIFMVLSIIFKTDMSIVTNDIYLSIGALVVSIPINILVREVRMKEAYIKMLYSSYSKIDELTGLPNRRAFKDKMYDILEGMDENVASIGIAIIDIDDFKRYNDRFGHLTGDFALRKIAQKFKDLAVKQEGFYARYGGEEFVCILRGRTENDVFLLLEETRKEIQHMDMYKEDSRLTISIGIGYLEVPEMAQVHKLLGQADAAMYYSKKQGKNATTLFSKLRD